MRISDWSSDVCSSDLYPYIQISRYSGYCTSLFGGLRIIGKRRAGADEIAVAIAVVDAVDRRPVFVGGRARREATFAARIGAAPLLVRRVVDRMRGMAQRALLHRPAAFLDRADLLPDRDRSEEHTSELQSLMRHSYAVLCLK